MEQIYNYIRIGFSNKSIRVDGDKLYMPAWIYWDTYCRGVDKRLHDKYGKEKLWLYNLDNGYIEKFVWDEECNFYC